MVYTEFHAYLPLFHFVIQNIQNKGFWLIPQEYFYRYKIQNICMLDMFTFDLFSVCHSRGQSVTDTALFTFWLIPQEYSCSQKTL